MFWNFTKTEVHNSQQPPPPSYYCPFHDAMTMTMTMMTMTIGKRAKISEDTVLQNTLKNQNF